MRTDPPSRNLMNGYAAMMPNYWVRQVREILQDRDKRIAAIRTRRQAERYRDEVADKGRRCFGPLPKRTPLQARITGVIEQKNFRIEKILFESRPGWTVTANLYVPANLSEPGPAVLGSCGHAADGKAAKPYQSFARELASSGLTTLIFDPVSQGERDVFNHLPENHHLRRSCTNPHNMMGKQLELTGDFFGMWRAWDAIRALDYLASRPEVDPERLAMTGNSGGGTMTTWTGLLDRRIRLVAPSCFVTSFLSNIENEEPQDAEQYPPGLLAEGLDMADFLIARAPDPAIVLAQRYCFFDHRGARKAAEETARIYRLLGAEDQFEFFVGAHTHGYHEDARIAMRRFVCRWAGKRFRRTISLNLQSPEELRAVPSEEKPAALFKPLGRVRADELSQFAAKRKPLNSDNLRRRVERILGVKLPRMAPAHFRVLKPQKFPAPKEFATARYAVETEPGIEAILRKTAIAPFPMLTLEVEPTVRLYVPHFSVEAEIILPWMRRYRKKLPNETTLYAVDVRGMGESRPEGKPHPYPPESDKFKSSEAVAFFHPYGMDYLSHGVSLMLGRSFLGQRVFDLLRVVQLLKSEGAKEVRLVGRGQGSLVALFATVLDESLRETELHQTPRSFQEWAESDHFTWPVANVPHGVLHHFDLPDLHQTFASRLRIVSLQGPDMPVE